MREWWKNFNAIFLRIMEKLYLKCSLATEEYSTFKGHHIKNYCTILENSNNKKAKIYY